MNVLISNTKNEFYKLVSRKKYIVLLILFLAVCLLRLGGSALIEKISMGVVQIRTNMMLEMLPFLAEIMTPLVVFMAATDLFGSEMQEDTMKAVLMRPITRLKVMTSKILAAFLIGCLYYLAVFVICAILQAVTGNALLPVLFTSLGAYLIDLIPMLGLVLMGVLVNMLTASPTLSMLLSIGIYAFFKYANYFLAPLGQMIFTAYLQWHRIWIGATLPFSAMISKVGLLFGTMLIFFTISYILFDKKEF